MAAPRSTSRTADKPDALAGYRARRDFRRSPEPRGDAAAAAGHRFAVQKNPATRLHFDLRLELGGELKSRAGTAGDSWGIKQVFDTLMTSEDGTFAVRPQDSARAWRNPGKTRRTPARGPIACAVGCSSTRARAR